MNVWLAIDQDMGEHGVTARTVAGFTAAVMADQLPGPRSTIMMYDPDRLKGGEAFLRSQKVIRVGTALGLTVTGDNAAGCEQEGKGERRSGGICAAGGQVVP